MLHQLTLAIFLTVAVVPVVAAAPGPPQTLAASVIGTTVTLTWQSPSTGGVPSSYLVEAALSPGGVPIANLPLAASPLVVPNVPNGVYYVRVRAVNLDGTSEPSNEVIVVVQGGESTPTPGCSAPPNPPILTGSASGNLVSLSWTPSAAGCPAIGFAVHAGSSPGLSNITIANVGAVTLLTSVAPAGAYYIRVVAFNTFGGSGASNEISLVVGGGGLYKGRIAASFVDDASLEFVAADISGAVMSMTRSTGAEPRIGLLHLPDSAPIGVALNEAGQPDYALIEDTVIVFGNYTASSVDVAIVPSSGPIDIITKVPLGTVPGLPLRAAALGEDDEPTLLTFKLRHLKLAVETATCIVGRIPRDLLKRAVAGAACSLTYQEAWRTLGLGDDPLAEERALLLSREASESVVGLIGAIEASEDCAGARTKVDRAIKCFTFASSVAAAFVKRYFAGFGPRIVEAKRLLVGPPGPLTGKWIGTYRYDAACLNFTGIETLDLVEDAAGRVTGYVSDVVLSPSAGTAQGRVVGSRLGTTVSLTLSYTAGTGSQPAQGFTSRFSGSINANELVGRTGACGVGAEVKFTRQ